MVKRYRPFASAPEFDLRFLLRPVPQELELVLYFWRLAGEVEKIDHLLPGPVGFYLLNINANRR